MNKFFCLLWAESAIVSTLQKDITCGVFFIGILFCKMFHIKKRMIFEI